MKTGLLLTLVVLLHLVCSQQAAAQTYYPLSPGNEWFYRDIRLLPGDSTISSHVRVLGDSLFPNGHRYSVLSDEDIMEGRFVRTDSTSIFYINPFTGEESRIFRLDGQPGDTTQFECGPFFTARLSSIDTVLVFQSPRKVLTFELDGILYAILKFCEGLGPMTEWRFVDPPPPWPDWGRELVGCLIDNVQYGRVLHAAEAPTTPRAFDLRQNYPNPFNADTRITYSLSMRRFVQLQVFDVLGRQVCALVEEEKGPGNHAVTWSGRDNQHRPVSSGVYFYQLVTPEMRETRAMVLLR